MNNKILFLAAIVMMICFGCSNDDDTVDLASSEAGLYNGTWNTYGSKHSGTCEVLKVTNTSVTLDMEIGSWYTRSA